jgi:hypothetical protein
MLGRSYRTVACWYECRGFGFKLTRGYGLFEHDHNLSDCRVRLDSLHLWSGGCGPSFDGHDGGEEIAMFIQSVPCGQVPSFPPNGQAAWDRQVGLGCPGMCGCGGMGLFDSGLDFSQWGIGEWATVAGVLYIAFSVFFTTKRGTQTVAKGIRRRRRSRKLQKAVT